MDQQATDRFGPKRRNGGKNSAGKIGGDSGCPAGVANDVEMLDVGLEVRRE
jgi:hypothetical protein